MSDYTETLNPLYLKLLESARANRATSSPEEDEQKRIVNVAVQALMNSNEAQRTVIEAVIKGAQLRSHARSFMRQSLNHMVLEPGQVPILKMDEPSDVLIALSPTKSARQFVRDTRLCPPEIVLEGKHFVEQRDLTSPYSALSELILNVDETMCQEERLMIYMMKEYPVPKYSLPTLTATLNTMAKKLGVDGGTVLMGRNFYIKAIGETAFVEKWAPCTLMADLLKGGLGTWNEKFTLLTDVYRHPQLRVLENDDLILIAPKDKAGMFTDRGGWNHEPITGATEGRAGRGAWMYESLSMSVFANSFLCVKG